MNTISQLATSTLYEYTTVIMGIGCLFMGTTLLTLRGSLKNSGQRSKSGLLWFSIAMFSMGIINLLEYIEGADIQRVYHSLSIVIFAVSVELFILFTAYMSMLNSEFATKRQICLELGCIVLFTTPAMLVSPENNLFLFNILFAIGLVFYFVKLILNVREYHKQLKKAKSKIESYMSNDSSLWLKWITHTFYVVITIGIASVIAPMTNMAVLVFYNSFLILAFSYIYISIIRNISIFDASMSILDSDETEATETTAPLSDKYTKPVSDFMSTRHQLLDEWIECRGYAVAGVTASEVATALKTNRTRLSQYIKNELHTTYYEWIAGLRIEDAKQQLIQHPDRAVYEIAMNVGIEDRDNFRRVFQRYVGVSPTTYRKEYTAS